nr:PAS domain S-box protein [uncultured Methanolobus sp.]
MSKGSERTSGTLSLRGQGYIALLGAALTLVILLFVLWQACAIYEDNLILNKQVEVNAQLSSNGNSLENRINNILSHLDGLDAFAKANPTKTALDTHFESFAFGLYAGSPSLRSIEIYTNFSETYVYPLEDNELVAERTLEDLINDERPIVRADLLNAIQTREPVITGPYEMQRGGLGMAARQPVYINDSLWGVVSMVIDVPPLLSSSGLTTADETIHMALRDDSGQIIFGSEETFQMNPLIYQVTLPEGSWELVAVPKGGWDESVADTLLVFQKGGIIIAILLTLVVYLLLSYSVSLKMEVKNRTASLKESESRYRQLFDNNSDSLFLFDENGKILDANKVAEDLYGYDRNQFLNMKVRDLSPINLRDEISPLKEITDTGAQFQWTHLRRNGAEFPVHINASPIELDNKKYILASVRDITESKEVEKALTESERRYRLLTDTARDFIIVHDLQGKLLYANKIAVEFSGYSEKELLSLNVTHFVSPAEQAKMYERRDHRVENNGETYLYETVFVDKDGNEIPVEVSSVPMQGENLKPSILIVARDITERKMTQSALIKSEEMFATVFNTVPDSIMLTSFDGRIINVNQSFLKNKGYRMDEVLGISLCDLTIWSDPDICKQYIHQLTFHGVVRNFETDIYTKYGEKHSVIISGDIITTDSEKYILTVFRNITELQNMADELKKSKFLLDEVSEIASIGGWSLDVSSGEVTWTNEVFKIHDMEPSGTINVNKGLDYYAPASKEIISKAVQDAIEKEQPYDLELEIITAKGNHKWVRASGRPIVVDNKVTKMIGSFQDITDRKQTEVELLKQDRLLNEMGDVAKIGGWEFDVLAGTSTWTREVAMIHGLDPDTGASVDMSLEYYPPQSREIISKAFQNAVEKGEAYDLELEFFSAKGVHKWVRTGGQPVFEDGKIVKVVGFLQDITHLKKVELELQKERVLLDEVGDIAKIGGWEFDVITGEGTWTPEVAKIHGLDPGVPTNKDIGVSLFVYESQEKIKAAIQNAIDNAEPYDLELELISADGVNKWVRTIGRPVVKDGKVVKLTGSMQDITERKLAADMLRESELRVRKKLNAILEPEGDLGELELADIVDIKALQELMDEFYQLTKMGGMAILDLKGNVLVDIGWQDICTKFHRVHPQTCKHCIESDLELTRGVEPGTYKFYKCKNHMWDMVTPIVLGGVHIGNLFVGQFFLDDEEIPYDTFRLQAEKYGFDEKQYLEALEKVPRWSRESVDSLMTYYALLTNLISTLSYSNVKLARTLNERDELLSSLHESESRFRATFEQAAVGVILSSLDGGFIQMNQRFCDISGYSCEELIIMNFADFTSPEDIEKETLLVEELVSGKRRDYSIEKRFICKGGRMLWVNVTVALVKSSDGEPLYFIGMVEDIDSRKLAEAEIELKSNALENSLNGFNIISSDGTFVYANKAYIRMWGYDTLNDVLESSPSSYFKYPEIAVDIFNKLRENGECTFEFTALRKDGSTFEALMYSQLFKDTDDNEIYMGTSIDITDRKEAEAEILQYTERLNMLHAIDKGIISSTSSEDIINSVLKNLRELISCPIVRLRAMDYERNDTVVLAMDSEYDSELKVGTHEYIMPSPTLDKLKSGSSVIVPDLYSYDSYNHELIAKFRNEDVRSVLIAPLIIEGELMGVLNLSSFEVDFFTEEHRAIVEEVATQLSIAIHHSRLNDQIRQHADELEQRVAERTEQLEDANKELEAFTYSVSHDLRAPLRAIDGFSRIITEDYEPIMDDEGKRLLNVIRDNTQKMDKLITDLLALSRVGRNEMSCVLINMDAMVRSVFNDLIPDENKNRTVLNVSDLPESYADPALIKQLWVNLLSNAIKYSSTRDKGVVEVGAYIKDGTNVYYVKDNGVGFNPKYSHKLFGIFQRLHSEKEFPGTGVGLAIVQRIARRHGGDVWAESELDNGATFYFSLPIKQGDDVCGE